MTGAAIPDAQLPAIAAVAVGPDVMDPTPTQPIDMRSLIHLPGAPER
jgi:hypothetical protein